MKWKKASLIAFKQIYIGVDGVEPEIKASLLVFIHNSSGVNSVLTERQWQWLPLQDYRKTGASWAVVPVKHWRDVKAGFPRKTDFFHHQYTRDNWKLLNLQIEIGRKELLRLRVGKKLWLWDLRTTKKNVETSFAFETPMMYSSTLQNTTTFYSWGWSFNSAATLLCLRKTDNCHKK